jgi:hypothetical protein
LEASVQAVAPWPVRYHSPLQSGQQGVPINRREIGTDIAPLVQESVR